MMSGLSPPTKTITQIIDMETMESGDDQVRAFHCMILPASDMFLPQDDEVDKGTPGPGTMSSSQAKTSQSKMSSQSKMKTSSQRNSRGRRFLEQVHPSSPLSIPLTPSSIPMPLTPSLGIPLALVQALHGSSGRAGSAPASQEVVETQVWLRYLIFHDGGKKHV